MAARIYGAFTDREDPGFHLVAIEDVDGCTDAVELIKVPVWEVEERRLIVGYEPCVEDMSDEVARALIVDALLNGFYQRDYEKDVDEVVFINRITGERKRSRLEDGGFAVQ
jgi:hypothetical protein